MSFIENAKFDQDLCRTCLRSGDDGLVSMYQDGEEVSIFDNISIAQMLNECSVYPIKIDDPFTKKICIKCIDDIKIAYNFRKQSESAYMTLKSFLMIDEDDNDDDDNNDTKNVLIYEESIDKVKNETIKKEFEEDLPPTEKCIQTDEVAFYPCEKCEKKFIDYEILKKHRQTDHKGSVNKCRACSKTYNKISHLKRHIANSHPEIGLQYAIKIHDCKICNKRFMKIERFRKHMQQEHNEHEKVIVENDKKIKKFYCTSCAESFQNENNYKNHKCKKESDGVENNSTLPVALMEPIMETEPTEEKIYENDFLDTNDDNDGYFSQDNKDVDIPFANNNANTTSDEEDTKPLAQLKIEVIKSKIEKKPSLAEINEDRSENKQIPEKEIKTEKLSPKAAGTKSSLKTKEKKLHRCEKCKKVFTRSTHLKRHSYTHSGEKPFSCDVCHKGFTRVDHLNLHKLNHIEVKPFVCDICNRGFVKSEHLRKHKESRHGNKSPNPKTEYCEICKRFFSSAKYLQMHIKSHLERRWNCKHCGEKFDEKSKLTEHMKNHSNEKPFLCSECGLRFVRNDYLVIHMRRHKGEKPYKCKFCGKGFPRATDLTVHERYHTGEKTHLCTICGKGFQRAYNLLVHMRVHTGERPYQCPHCSKCFAQGNDLKAHIRRHTGERFKCDVCGSGFIQVYHLTQHKRTVHGIETQSHIRRVEKFVTPVEQQKQVEALQNKLKKSTSPANSYSTKSEKTTETLIKVAQTPVTVTATEAIIPKQTKVLQAVGTQQNRENRNIILEDEIKTEENPLEDTDCVQTQKINIGSDPNQLLQTTTQYLVVDGSMFTPVSTTTPIYFAEIDSKVKYEHFE